MAGTSRNWALFGRLLYAPLTIGAGAVVAYTDAFQRVRGIWHELPSELRWGLLGALALAAVTVVAVLASKKSVLRRPDRFRVTPHDPRHLVGREQEIEDLCAECESQGLVFLVGESGAGKSSLIDAGLLPRYEDVAENRPAPALVPLLIDASGLVWEEGLKQELARKIRSLRPLQLNRIGAESDPTFDDPFALLASLPSHAPSKLLLVLDQIDDYLLEHAKHFLHRRKVISPERLISSNSDWELLSYAIQTKRVHVVIVGRSDAVMLDALQLSAYTKFVLTRLDPHLIRPLFDLITQPDSDGVVVEFPANGWNQLRTRLLRDLSASGQVLPMQLVIALDSLRRLRYLTVSSYSRCGGLLGLERIYIERHAADISGEAGLDRLQLLHSLRKLATEDGAKTCRLLKKDFITAAFNGAAHTDAARRLVDHLIRNRVIRTQTGRDGESVMLYHDYLARGVVEAYRRANRWVEKLKTATREFETATSLLQRWRALLSLQDLAALVFARLGSRFRFGEYRRVAVLSALRCVPILFLGLAAVLVERRFSGVQERQRTAEYVAQIAADGDNRFDAEAWQALSLSSAEARAHACLFALSRPALARSINGRADAFAHTLVGFDPSYQMRHRLVIEAILPALSTSTADAEVIRTAGAITNELALSRADLLAVIEAITECLSASASDSVSLACHEQIRKLARTLDPDSACQVGALVAKNAQVSANYGSPNAHAETLCELMPKAIDSDGHIVVKALISRMKDGGQHAPFSHILKALFDKVDFKRSPEYIEVVREAVIEAGSSKDSVRADSFGSILPNIAGCVPGHLAGSLQPDVAGALSSATSAKSVSGLLMAATLLGISDSPQLVESERAQVVRHLSGNADHETLTQLVYCARRLGGKGDRLWSQTLATAVSHGVHASNWIHEYHPRGQLLISLLPDLGSKDRNELLEMMSSSVIPNSQAYSLPMYHDDDLLVHLSALKGDEFSAWRRRIAEACLRAIVSPPQIIDDASYTDVHFCVASTTAIRRFRDQLSDAEIALIEAALLSRAQIARTLSDRISLRGEYIALRLHADSERDSEWAGELSRRLLDGLESGEEAAAKPAFELAVGVCQDFGLGVVGDNLVEHIKSRRPLGQVSELLDVVCARLPERALDQLACSLADRLLEGNPDEVVAELQGIGDTVWPMISPSRRRQLGRRAIDAATDVSERLERPYAASFLLQIVGHLSPADLQDLWPEILRLTSDPVLWPGVGFGTSFSNSSLRSFIDNLSESEAIALCQITMREYSREAQPIQLMYAEDIICALFSRIPDSDRLRVSEWAAERALSEMQDFRLVASINSQELVNCIPQHAAKRLVEKLFVEAAGANVPELMSIHAVLSNLRCDLPKPDASRLMEESLQRFRAAKGTLTEPWHGAIFGHFLGCTDSDTVMDHLPFVLECVRSDRNSVQAPHFFSIASGAVGKADHRSRPALFSAVLEKVKATTWDSAIYLRLLESLIRGSSDAERGELVRRLANNVDSDSDLRRQLSGGGRIFHESLRYLLPEEQAEIAASLLRFLAHRRFEASVPNRSLDREITRLSPSGCDFVAQSLVKWFEREATEDAEGRRGAWGLGSGSVEGSVRDRVLDAWLSVQNGLDPSRSLAARLQVRVDALNLPTHSVSFHPRIINDVSRILGVEFSGDRFELLRVLDEKGASRGLEFERVRR